MLFDRIIHVMLAIQAFSILLCFLRAITGPTMHDRVVALDTTGYLFLAFAGAIMIVHRTVAYTEIVLIIGVLTFISSIAIAKYLEKGGLFERR